MVVGGRGQNQYGDGGDLWILVVGGGKYSKQGDVNDMNYTYMYIMDEQGR